MSKQVRLRRGTTAQSLAFTGADGELTHDTDLKELRLHDGANAGGKRVALGLTLDGSGNIKVPDGCTLAMGKGSSDHSTCGLAVAAGSGTNSAWANVGGVRQMNISTDQINSGTLIFFCFQSPQDNGSGGGCLYLASRGSGAFFTVATIDLTEDRNVAWWLLQTYPSS